MESDFLELVESVLKCSVDIDFKSLGLQSLNDPKQLVAVANWIRFARVELTSSANLDRALTELDRCLDHRSFLVADAVTLADIAVWALLIRNSYWQQLCDKEAKNPPSVKKSYPSLRRLVDFITQLPEMQKLCLALGQNVVSPHTSTQPKHTDMNSVQTKTPSSKGRAATDMKFEEGGKFSDLPGSEMGKVVVRFPPEASGFMHIGHAKAALLNYHYKQIFNGKLILRFDDTNPAKENAAFEEAILEDLPRLGVKWDDFTFTSNYFDKMIDLCTQMIKDRKAYADDTDAETMRAQREERKESACRNNSVEKNLAMWKAMQEGTEAGLKTCIRAKIDMSSDNGAMRDPTIYRCKLEPHIRTGTKFKVFPIYDFACPIVDSLEGVTHALRTSEYNDRNDQYYWMCDALNIRRPQVIDFSRLALQSTLLSKRKLTWFVDQGLVSGWDDPRMPTVRGILRHGLTPEGLRQFILAQGSSKSTGIMEWDKIWAFNKKVIDPVAPRYTGLNLQNGLVPVHVKGQNKDETKQTPLHPKNADIGEKTLVVAPTVLVEQADAECFVEGDNVTFVNWGNLRICKVLKKGDRIESVDAELNLEDTDYKKTHKVTWLADPTTVKHAEKDLSQLTPLSCLTYGPLISKPIIGKEEKFEEFVNRESVSMENYLGDPQLRNLKKGDIIQLQRKGFFICDQPFTTTHPSTGKEAPCVLIYIPDGTTKTRPTTGSKFKTGESAISKPEQPQETKEKSSPKMFADLPPEEALKRAEKERLKEEKKAARKAGREKAKAQQQQQSQASSEVSEMKTEKLSVPPISSPTSSKSNSSTVDKQKQPNENQEKMAGEKQHKQPQQKKAQNEPAPSGPKKQTRLGLEVKKEEDTAEWYTQVIQKSDMLEYYDISGCYILRPWSYFIWSQIQSFFDSKIFDLGVENTYFPIFVSKAALEREKDHIAEFAPEVAWVTRSGSSDLAEPIALRPTSETIMYPAFAKWIQSHRDLPIKINQWSNIVRWEFKHPTPFLRTREFLWQEGHTAYAVKADAEAEVLSILDLYRAVYHDLLAVPCIRGRKTEREKFPGGEYTTTVEVYVSVSGRAIQGATSHHLGQNFSRMFDVIFEDPVTKQPQHVYQNSWGITTRTIGVMIMVHSDNQGLVLPPPVARYQVVVVPCGLTVKTTDEERADLLAKSKALVEGLSKVSKLRVHLDDRDHVSPGWKFNHWELKGVPMRIEVGFKDLAKGEVTTVMRYTGNKLAIPMCKVNEMVPAMLDEVHNLMLNNAIEIQNAHICEASSMKQLTDALDKKCLVLAPFCGEPECEDLVKTESAQNVVVAPGAPAMGAKSLCIPFEGEIVGKKTGPCGNGVHCLRHPLCLKPATYYTLFGRSY
nr:glutamyl tRNA synthetase cytoplasmic [Hymenolepis microstoma]